MNSDVVAGKLAGMVFFMDPNDGQIAVRQTATSLPPFQPIYRLITSSMKLLPIMEKGNVH